MDKITYEVAYPNGETTKHRSESTAIWHARKANGSVIMIVQSGTYRSTTQIWPKVGETYTN